MDIEVVIDSQEGGRRVERMPAVAPISIGRSPTCTLCLESDLVSRRHAVVQVHANALQVEDVSTNGTMAGQQLLRRDTVQVPFGTPVVVGEFTLTIHPAGQIPSVVPPMQGQVPAQPDWGGLNAPGAGAPLPPPGRPLPPPMAAGPGFVPPGVSGGSQTARPPAPAVPSPGLPRVVVQDKPPMARPVVTAPQARPKPPGLRQPPARASGMPRSAIEMEAKRKAAEENIAFRREVHKQLLEHLDLAAVDASKLDDPSMRPKVLTALRKIVTKLEHKLPPNTNQDTLVGELADEALGLGPLERYLADPTISEVMVVGPDAIYIEREGKLIRTDARFTDDDRVRAVIERIVTPLGRRIDESSPLVDARLKDGSRVNAVIRPIALRGSCITIRKFSRTPLTLPKLIDFGAISEAMGRFLIRCVVAKRNVVISGGTGSGKTTLLNVLSAAIPEDERIITIEDAAELQLGQPHVVSLETRPANMEGKGEYTIRDLVRNALRMRPDRIVVGECRGGEALDMLQAMNTGHDGSLTTTHANSPAEALQRLETLALMAGVDLPSKAIRDQIASSVHVIVQQSRFSDGTRKVTQISEVAGMEDDGSIELLSIFEFERTGTGPKGEVLGRYRSTGYLPSFLDQFIVMGLVKPGEPYL